MKWVAIAEIFREFRILLMYIQDDRFYALCVLLLLILVIRLVWHR